MDNGKSSRAGIGGPKTGEGKKRSSMNALKHGLFARSPEAQAILDQDMDIDFEEYAQRMRNHYKPSDPIEDELVTRIARCSYRLAVSAFMERRLHARNPYMGRPGDSYQKVMRFERLVDIHLHRAIGALRKKRESESVLHGANELGSRSA